MPEDRTLQYERCFTAHPFVLKPEFSDDSTSFCFEP
jgi:hypothetical protein